MTSMRRMGTESSKTRAQLLDAAEALMRSAGYAAVTTRRLAAHAGLKPQLVHYYFRTMDHLFVDLFNRMAGQYLIRQRELLSAPNPLQELWNVSLDHDHGVLTMEFVALANHRKMLRTAIAEFGEQARRMQSEIIARILRDKGIDTEKWPPAALAFILECVPRSLVIETVLGQSTGHPEVLGLAARIIDEVSRKTAVPAA